MRVTSRYMGTWGHDRVPVDADADAVPSFKFMNLHAPVTQEFGGQYHLSGAWGVHFFGPSQAAVCVYQEEKRIDPENNNHVQWHEIPGPNEFESNSCNCGIHSQNLNNIVSGSDFRMGTLCQLDMKGNIDYTDAGYRTSHGIIKKIWTTENLDHHQLDKVKKDLGIDAEIVPVQYHSGRGANWPEFVKDHPDLSLWLPKEKEMMADWDRQSAATSLDPNKDPDHEPEEYPCNKCGSNNLGLIENPSGHKYGRLGHCNNCGNSWARYCPRCGSENINRQSQGESNCNDCSSHWNDHD